MTNDAGQDYRDLTLALRWMSDMLCYWVICAKPACTRAAACKGEPRKCLVHYAPLAPQDARYGLGQIMEALNRGLSQDEIREAEPEAVAALDRWQDCVVEADRRRRAHGRRTACRPSSRCEQ